MPALAKPDTHIQLAPHLPEDMREAFLAQRAAYKQNRLPSLAESIGTTEPQATRP